MLIGGTGLLGPSLVQQLEDEGRDVICINRSGKHPHGGEAIAANRNSFDELRKLFRKLGAFHLVDVIPYTARQAALLLEALEGKQPQFTAVSSIDVYQAYNNLHPQGRTVAELQELPLLETSSLRDRLSFQGLEYDKLNVERIYLSYFDACTILRMPAIYGLPDTSRVERYVQNMLADDEIVLTPGLASWRFSRSLNLNCAHAIALGVGYSGHEVFNVAEQRDYTELEWCKYLASLLGVEPRMKIDAAAQVPYNMNTEQHWVVDSSKIRKDLGYHEKYSAEEGIREVLSELHTERRMKTK